MIVQFIQQLNKVRGLNKGMIQVLKHSLVAVLVLLLVACETTPTKQDNAPREAWLTDSAFFQASYASHANLAAWRYSAKVGVVAPDGAEQANMIWVFERPTSNVVRLFGPLGLGAIKIEFDEQGVTLSDRKGLLHKGHNAQQLLEDIVGLSIPVDALHYWLFSLPLPNAAYDYRLDQESQLGVLRQLGWVINYSNYRCLLYTSPSPRD